MLSTMANVPGLARQSRGQCTQAQRMLVSYLFACASAEPTPIASLT